LSSGDVVNALSNLVQVLPVHLKKGDSIRLGDLGSFRLSVTSEGVSDANALSLKNIKKPHLVFLPGVKLKKLLADITYSLPPD
jgi:predicted histone-like DNA-binding protein